jgi:hypothetical protein
MKILNQHVNDLEMKKISGSDAFNNAILNSWKYRKSTTVSRASGAITDYQMKLLVGESSGATGEEVDCGGKCLSSFNDLRFTKLDGKTLLPYFIESVTGTTPNQLATVWIKVDEIFTTATRIYMYYGNSGASSYSNGTNTFIKFDDFERGNDGDNVGGFWTEATPHCHISTEQKYGGTRSMKLVGGTSPVAHTIQSTVDNIYAIQCRGYKETASTVFRILHGNATWRIDINVNSSEQVLNYITSWVATGQTITADSWNYFELRNINFTAHTFDLLVGTNLVTGLGMSNQAFWAFGFCGSGTSGQDSWVDNFIVRNWRTVEPAWSGTWSGEEIL